MRADLEAVLFDLDGTLVETEQLWGESLFELARRLGGRMSAAAREATVGTSMRSSMRILYADLGLRGTEQQLAADAAWVEQNTARLLAERLHWRPGARELLTEVRAAGLATALVTTTPRPVATVVLRQIAEDLGADPFQVTVCGNEAGARKPDPAPYRHAMAALGVAPAGCLVVEDSAVGVTSALSAGTVVLGVPSLQALAPAPALVLADTLTGVDLGRLRRLHADRNAAA